MPLSPTWRRPRAASTEGRAAAGGRGREPAERVCKDGARRWWNRRRDFRQPNNQPTKGMAWQRRATTVMGFQTRAIRWPSGTT